MLSTPFQKITAPIFAVLALSSLGAHVNSTQFRDMSSASFTLFAEVLSPCLA